MKKSALILAILSVVFSCIYAQNVSITSIPYDALMVHADSTGKNILDRKNCPVTYADLKPADYVYPARRGYSYKKEPIRADLKPASKEVFVELMPVSFAAKDDFRAAVDSTAALLNYLEFYPMLANGEFYSSFYKAMEKKAGKNKNLKMKNIMGDIAYKDEKSGVCAVTSVTFEAGAKQSPMAPAAAGDGAMKNTLNVYFFGSGGKLKYQIERSCRKYISFDAVFDAKKNIIRITEDYVTLYLNNMQGDIHVKLEYTVALSSMKFSFDKVTYYTEIDGQPYKPVSYAVKSGVADVKNNK